MASSLLVTYFVTGTAINDANTTHTSIAGRIDGGTESNKQTPIRDAGVFSNLFVYVLTNTTTTVSSTVTLQDSTVDTALIVTYAAAETGIKEDTSNTATFTDTDEAVWEITVPNEAIAATLTVTLIGAQWTPTVQTNCISYLIQQGPNIYASASSTDYRLPNGNYNDTWQGTEANVAWRVRSSFVSSDFYVFVSANLRTTDTVFGTRVNSGGGAANGNQSVTYAGAETGAKEDTSNTDTLLSGYDFNYRITTSTGTENITSRVMSTSLINTTNQFPLLVGADGGITIAFNNTLYTAVAGRLRFDADIVRSEIYPRFDFTVRELAAFVITNTIATSATTIHLMEGGVASGLTISYAAGETGLKINSTDAVFVESGVDEIAHRVVTPNTSGNFLLSWISMLGSTPLGFPAFRTLLGVGI